MGNGHRSAWRLRVHLPDLESVDRPALFRWIREHVIPAALAAPFRVTVELVPPDDVRDDE